MNTELIAQLTAQLVVPGAPFAVSRAGRVTGPDGTAHTAAFDRDPAGYALLALLPGVRVEQRARILLQLLASSRIGWSGADRHTVDRVVRLLVLGLPAHTVGTVLLALRHRRANHKHVTRAAVRLLVQHADAAGFVRTHRRVALSIVEHALGKATARGVARALRTGDTSIVDVRRALLRFGADPDLATRRMLAVYGAAGDDGAAYPVAPPDLDLDGERPAVVTATNRGDLAATYVHALRGGAGCKPGPLDRGFRSAAPAGGPVGAETAQLHEARQRYLAAASARVPTYPGRLAVVLDRSGSTDGYGEREYAVTAQIRALAQVLRERCANLVAVRTPGEGTDLAGGVIAALRERPDLVAVVTDGYENTYEGDLARVAATLPALGLDVPVVLCVATFGHSDDLLLRRPAPGLPRRAFWHEADFGSLVLWLLMNTRAATAGTWLRTALAERLDQVEGGLVA